MSSAVPMARNFAAGDDATQQLTRIWEDLLNVRPIEPEQNYFELGGDSLTAVQMFAQIEQVFQLKLPMATLFEAPTIADLARIVNREAPRSRWSSLVTIQGKGSRPPLFCMHATGGNVLIYRELSNRLGNDQPLYGLQSQGLDGNSEPQTRIEDMASAYLREIRRIQPRGPYYLGGYCLGGTIAYEVAQQFCRQGEEVALLALFDTHNWCKLPPLTPWKRRRLGVESVLFHVLNYFRLDGKGRRKFLEEKFRILRNRTPVWKARLFHRPQADSHWMGSTLEIIGKIWTANDRAAMIYIPKPYSGVITDFRPLGQYSIYRRNDLKWEDLAQGGQQIVELPVYPAGMMVEPFVSLLAEALKKSIDSVNSK